MKAEDWISVKDRLPPDYQDLLLWDGFIRYRGYRTEEKGFMIWEGEYNQARNTITHWVPLPAPPHHQ
jgi:hypothetical protein